jgi:lipoate-protein ligase A
MALDEALLESVGTQKALPVLRLYSWAPGCVSLGYAQPASDIDHQVRVALGWDIVRRPTGGRAVLHIDELTYAVIAPLDEPRVKGSILESYRRLSLALLNALRKLGLDPSADKEYQLPEGSQKDAAVCFEVPSNYEITVEGKKLIGSAQARKHKAVLQHGSLPLFGDITRILRVMHFSSNEEKESATLKLLNHATTVETITGTQIPFQTVAQAYSEAFSETLEIQFEFTQPTQKEISRAHELEKEKYKNPDWINHR